jgi:5,10-methylenetetrahydromethanopterin reductase
MRVGIRLPPSQPLRELVRLTRRAEDAGLSHAWLPDSPLNFREVWTTLGALAVSTDHIGLAPAVTNLSSRHPSVTASAARTLAEACPGRFILGIGTGDSAVGFDGLAPKSNKELREGIIALRHWMSGTPSSNSPGVRLRHGGTVPPVFLAASGSRNLHLAGELADGAITPLARLEEKIARVREGASTASRGQMPEIAVTAQSIVSDAIERDAALLSPFIVRIAQLEGTELFERAGMTLQVPPHTVGALGDVGHPDSLAEAAVAASEFVSSDVATWYARTCTISGDTKEILSALAGLEQMGVDRVTLSPLAIPMEEFIDFLGSVVG